MNRTKTDDQTAAKQRAGREVDPEQIAAFRQKNRYYYSLLVEMLRFYIPEGSRVLDIGCGLGDTLAALQPSYGVGIDAAEPMVHAARLRHPELTFIHGDADTFDAGGAPFDFIILVNTIGFLPDIQSAFKHLKRFAGPATRIIIMHYNHLWEPVLKWGERLGLKVREPYQNWLSLNDTENLLRLEGFECVRKHQAVLVPKKIPLLSAFLNRFAGNLPLLWRLGLVHLVIGRPGPTGAPRRDLSVSVVIPARNERGNIERIIRSVPEMGRSTELIFVEGHSKDGTYEEIERIMGLVPDRPVRLFRQDGEGKADAVWKGFDQATGDVLMILDADLTVAAEDLMKFYEAIASGRGELAIGNRLVYQQENEAMRTLNLLGNKIFGLLFTCIIGQHVRDTLCGTKALLRENYARIRGLRGTIASRDPFGDFDLIFGAEKAGLKIVDIPVRYRKRTYGETQIRRFYHGMMLFRMVWAGFRRLKFR